MAKNNSPSSLSFNKISQFIEENTFNVVVSVDFSFLNGKNLDAKLAFKRHHCVPIWILLTIVVFFFLFLTLAILITFRSGDSTDSALLFLWIRFIMKTPILSSKFSIARFYYSPYIIERKLYEKNCRSEV